MLPLNEVEYKFSVAGRWFHKSLILEDNKSDPRLIKRGKGEGRQMEKAIHDIVMEYSDRFDVQGYSNASSPLFIAHSISGASLLLQHLLDDSLETKNGNYVCLDNGNE